MYVIQSITYIKHVTNKNVIIKNFYKIIKNFYYDHFLIKKSFSYKINKNTLFQVIIICISILF